MGAVAGCPITAVFDGDASLRSRPMRRVLDPLERIGAHAVGCAEGGRLPVTLKGARDPMPIVFEPPVASAQLKSAVLLAGLAAPGETIGDRARGDARPHREDARCISAPRCGSSRMAPTAGASRSRASRNFRRSRSWCRPIRPRPRFRSIAALITPGSDLILDGVMTNPLRAGLLTTLAEMGASIERLDARNEGGDVLGGERTQHHGQRRHRRDRRRPDAPVRGEAAGRARGAIVVVQEAFGVNPHIEDVTRRAAAAGYHAVAPEFFHRSGPGAVVEYGKFEKVMEYFQATRRATPRSSPTSTPRSSTCAAAGFADAQIGAVGFCFGGRVSFLVALRYALGAAVGFYGGGIVTGRFPQFPPLVDEVAALQTPWLGLFGDQDALDSRRRRRDNCATALPTRNGRHRDRALRRRRSRVPLRPAPRLPRRRRRRRVAPGARLVRSAPADCSDAA